MSTTTAKKKTPILIPLLALVVLVAGAGGAAWYFLRESDPLKRADDLMAKGDVRAAQIELRNAVRNDPNNGEAHLRLAQAQAQLADPVAAEKEFKSARDLGVDRWVIIPQLGQVYMAQGRYQDILTEVPPEGPKPEIAAKNLMLRSMAQVGMNDLAAANASLAAAEKAAPGNADVLLMAARLALALRDLPAAEKKADEVLKLDPKSVEALLMRGQVLMARDDRQGSMEMANRAIEAQPTSAPARLDRANQFILANQDPKAQADVNYVLDLQPRNAGATYLNAVLMIRGSRYGDAQVELQKLGPVIARFPRALYFQSLAAANLGQTEAAVDFANRYLTRLPSDPEAVRLVARTELTAQRPERAVAALSKAVADGRSDGPTLDLLGRAYAQMGKPVEAVEAFKKAVAASPDDPTFLTHLASQQMQLGDSTAAERSLDRSVQIAPNQPNAGEAQVAAAISSGDLERAENALNRLRASAGETEAVGILTGMVRLGHLDLEGGRVAFATTLKLFPDSVNAKLNLGKVLILQGRKSEGETLLKDILIRDPANIPTLNTYVQILTQTQQYPPAIQALEAARAAAPKNVALTAMISDLIVRSGDPRRAVAMLQAMRNQEELQPMALFALARAQAAAGLNDEAKNSYRDLLKATPADLDARRGQVDLLIKMKEPDVASASLKEALAQAPGNIGVMSTMVQLEARAYGIDAALRLADSLRNNPANLPNSTVLRGDALMQLGRYDDAATSFLTEFKLQPTAPLVMRLANAQVSANKMDEATKTLRDWQEKHLDDLDTAQMLGLLDLRMKRYQEAARNLSIVLGKRPGDVVALNNLAWIYQLAGDPRARSLAQRAYLTTPTAETADTLGWVLVKAGEAKTAVILLQQATGQRPTDPTIKYHLAVALRDAGQREEALKIVQPAVASPDAFDDKPAARLLMEELSKK